MTRMGNFKALDPRAILPVYAYPGDAGMDFAIVGDHTLAPGESRDLPSGLAVEFPPGYWGRITGRSSTLRKLGLFVNEGVIDSGYRGELLTYVTNRNATPVRVEHGTRLAQLIVSEVVQTETRFVEELAPSLRGDRGFGSTGRTGFPEASPPEQPSFGLGTYEVYLGGPVDYGEADSDYHRWRHAERWSGIDTYCPICMNKDETEPVLIVKRNTEALVRAPFAVFDLRMIHHSIGTPVEIEQYLSLNPGGRAILVHTVPEPLRGIFLRWWASRGALVAPDFEEAARVVRAGLLG